MIKRTIDISHPCYLKRKQAQLIIERPDLPTAQVPFEDLGVLILSHPQITLTQGVLEACAKQNCAIVHCDSKHLPTSLTLPVASHSLHTKTLYQQIQIKTVRKKQLWQQIIKSKITEQSNTLKLCNRPHTQIQKMINQVQTDDKTNMEAQAAQKYWKTLVGPNFKRDPDAEGLNSQLNYGYAIIRSVVARALVGTGFHPSIGLNHHNQYNPYCLADDIMEPFRPWVDEITMLQNSSKLNQKTKQPYLTLIAEKVSFKDQTMPFMVALSLFISDLKLAYQDQSIILKFPTRVQV
ncbi:MAG: type II CRISPR-associated endonuclease Cas1 [Pseudomonadota bacterium]|nr:type II CRISPR-associated endonuclease Cas1 [Pseudomonadota bacterium]